MPDFKIAPTVNGVAIIRADGSVPMSGDLHLDNTLTFSDGTQEWEGTVDGNHLAFQSQTSAVASALRLFSKDGDGTDTIEIEIFGKGLPGAATNRERILIGWNSGGNFIIQSENAGTGTLRPLIIYTGTDTDQLVVAIDGRIGVQQATPTAQLEVVGTAVTGPSLLVSRNLALASTDSPVVSIIQDNSGDDQIALYIRQDAGATAYRAERVVATLNALAAPAHVLLTSTGDMVDGHGPQLSFLISDTGIGATTIGAVGAIRSGADNSGAIVLVPVNAGVASVQVTVLPSGKTGFGIAVPTATVDIVQTQTTGEALQVTRDLAAASSDSPLVNFIVDNVGDDQVALRVQQDGTGDILQMFIGATAAWTFTAGGLAGNNATPTTQMDLTTDATLADRGLMVEQHSTNTASAAIYFRKSRNTRASPTAIGSADFIGAFSASVYDGTSYLIPGGFAFKMAGTVSTGVIPMDIVFSAGAADDPSLTNVRMTIKNTGEVGIGISDPVANILGVKAGTSTNDAAVGGLLYMDSAIHGNTTTTKTDLSTYTVPANTLAVNNQSLVFEAWGQFANNANSKVLRMEWGADIVGAITSATAALQHWYIKGHIVRTGAATQDYLLINSNTSGNTTPVIMGTNLTRTLSGSNILKITGQATATNDITQKGFKVYWEDANT